MTATAITGKITAQPNPIPLAEGSITRIAWETNDPLGAEVHVSTPEEGDKLVTRGPSGSVKINWIAASRTYRFDLYSSTEPDRRLDQISVQRSNGSLESVLDEVAINVPSDKIDLGQLAKFIGQVAPRCVNSARYPEFFSLWQEHGVHITPVHFYQPIPDTRTLPESLWERRNELVGIEMNDAVQLDLLCNCFPKFRDEYKHFPASAAAARPGQFHFDNGRFDGTDALVTYCMVRHFRPRRIIEVGSGYSSLISGQAAVENGNTPLICIEPFPLDFLVQGFPGFDSLLQKKVEDVALEFFSQLGDGDILFIDSSHTVKIGGDVNYLFLEVLPRLNPGVIIHVHDIQFPFDYRREWVVDECRFWTEQYLLQAFLAFNCDFEVLFANNYLAGQYLNAFQATFPNSPWWGGGSFWMRRKPAANSPQT